MRRRRREARQPTVLACIVVRLGQGRVVLPCYYVTYSSSETGLAAMLREAQVSGKAARNAGHEVREAAALASIVVNLRGRGGTVASSGPRIRSCGRAVRREAEPGLGGARAQASVHRRIIGNH